INPVICTLPTSGGRRTPLSQKIGNSVLRRLCKQGCHSPHTHTLQHMEFTDQGSDPSSSLDLSHSCSNTRLARDRTCVPALSRHYRSPCLGGTCVNVGCIPKKLMHQAALLGQALRDSRNYGWNVEETIKHDWERMTEAVQNHIGSLNWGYRVALREKKVTYENAYGQFVGPHRIKVIATNNKGKEKIYSAEKFLIATGERPRYLGIPGDKEYCISSDDLFSLPYCPGKTLVVGASYVALECAGFLAGIGLDVTVMVRSILLRGFDQDMANKIGEHMEEHGVKFIRQFVPIKVSGAACKFVLLAIGRDACTRNIEKALLFLLKYYFKQTNVPYVYAIGDILEGKPELTPVAIQAGRLLAQRLYGGSTCDYENVPTTVFTPLEYGACGLSEEKAVEKFGEENIEIYHSYFWPLEWTIPSRDNNKCYAKIVCNIKDNERVVGFHILGPNAGEVTQGFAAALKCGLTKDQLDSTIGIHPVCAEVGHLPLMGQHPLTHGANLGLCS
uniref:Thioredoxin reductase 1, cytoplasmic n=1 Tax=Sus scrofa TaxID=9823 RepID=A0A5G2QDB8_PIG